MILHSCGRGSAPPFAETANAADRPAALCGAINRSLGKILIEFVMATSALLVTAAVLMHEEIDLSSPAHVLNGIEVAQKPPAR